MIAVIDYGAGNLRSVLHALGHLGVTDMRLVRRPDELEGADKVILPGVGAFGAGMQQLHRQGLVEPIRAAVRAGLPYLGICLGMQFLFDHSDEMGQHDGLKLLEGHVTRFPERPGLKVPHMGWNALDIVRPSFLLGDLPQPAYAYFVHSYFCVPANPADTIATVHYGDDFCVAVQRENILGVQFHPEKSQQIGLQILQNFIDSSDFSKPKGGM